MTIYLYLFNISFKFVKISIPINSNRRYASISFKSLFFSFQATNIFLQSFLSFWKYLCVLWTYYHVLLSSLFFATFPRLLTICPPFLLFSSLSWVTYSLLLLICFFYFFLLPLLCILSVWGFLFVLYWSLFYLLTISMFCLLILKPFLYLYSLFLMYLIVVV